MKVLVIGRGVVGTIYGWALSKAGIDVTHVVRKEGLPDTDTLDLLDLRPRYSKNKRVSYAPKTVAQINPSDGFELVIVATKHYQAAQAIHQYLPGASGATFLLFTANWDGPGEIDRLLPRSSILWAYAAASGGPDDRGILVATVNPTVRFGMLEGSDPEKFKAVTGLFQRAGFSLDIKPNIIEWLWVHHAINAGSIGICLWAGGIAEAARSFTTLRLGTWATRGGIGCPGGPWRRPIALSGREKYFEYASQTGGSCRYLCHSVHGKGSTPSQGEPLRPQPGGNETLLLRCAQHGTEPGSGHAALVIASRKDRTLSGKRGYEDSWQRAPILN
jgi:2-dehydropantoate 2-reductase